MRNISIIVAVAHHQVIGINNTLPWHLPEDLKHFRALTTGHHIIMGRKTYESLGRLLPDRTTVIVTRNLNYRVEGAKVACSLQAAVDLCIDDPEPFLIGGSELYRHALPLVNKIYMTRINLEVEGDAFFPDIDMKYWKVALEESHQSANGMAYQYITYEKQNPN